MCMTTKAMDLTVGSIPQKMLTYSWPIFLTNLLQTSYQFIDSLWIGNLIGASALGAVSVSFTVLFTILSFIIGINGASLTVVSQLKGKNDEKGLKQSLNAFVVILGLLTLCVSFIGFFSSPAILRLLGTPDDILPMAAAYLQVNFLGIIFLFGYNFIGTVLRAVGDSRTPIRFVMMAVVLNAVLDPLFIAVFKLGIAGAAYATILSQGIAFVYGVWYSVRTGKVPFTRPTVPEASHVKTVIKLGLPGGLQMMAVSSGLLFIMSIVTSFGKDVVAGFGVAQRIESLIMLPAMTLGSAVNSMSGQNIGAGKWNRVKGIAQSASFAIVSISLAIGLAVFLGAEQLVRLFIDDEPSIRFGTLYLQAVAFFYPFLGINFVLNGIIRSSGAMFAVLTLNLISFWVLRYPLTYILSERFGEVGIAYGVGSSFILSSAIATAYYFWGGWKKVKLFEEKEGKSA
jgi:putative MATE family efflux protein